MKTKHIKLLAALLALAAPAAHGQTTLFFDDFNGGTGNLNGTTPDITTGSATWLGPNTAFLADGTIQDAGNGAGTATLAFTPSDGFVYTLDASVSLTGTDTNWLPFGFAQGQSTSTSPSLNENRFIEIDTIGKAWMFARQSTTATAKNGAFLGNATNGLVDSADWLGSVSGTDLDLRIELNTIAGSGSWTATWYAKASSDANYTKVRDTATLLNETINSVGFGKSNSPLTGSINSFTLTAIPEPSAALLIGGIGILVLFRRRR